MKAKAIFTAIKRFLKDSHTDYVTSPIPGGHSITCLDLPSPDMLTNITQTIDIWDTHLFTYAHCPVQVEPEYIDEMAKFIALANYNLLIGNFDLDVDTGEIRFRHYLDCAGFKTLPDAVLRRNLPIPLVMLDQHGDAIASVANGESDAETALTLVKQNT